MSRKSQPNAGQRRKSRAPEVSIGGVKRHKEAISDLELMQLAYRLEEYERLRVEGILNKQFIALEALAAFSGGLVSGRTESQLKTTWPKEWGEETITVPFVLVRAICEAWAAYKQAPTGSTLGEAFKIEGGNQGAQPMKLKLAQIDKARLLAREVEALYYKVEGDENPLTLNDAIEAVVSENEGKDNKAKFDTVHKAYKKHRDSIRSALTDIEVLK